MQFQKTIKKEISFEGTGLHSGKTCKVTLYPAKIDSGIVFFRTDRGIMIKIHPLAVVDTSFATTIGYNGTRIKTIEHLLSAISAFEIDNICIDVEGSEIPALDGSALEIAKLILQAGIMIQSTPKRIIEITQPISIKEGIASITALPYHGRKFTQKIEFNSQFLNKQEFSIELTPESFLEDIAPARTFGFVKDLDMLRQNGLAKGASLENAVGIDGNKILNPSGLRFPDEFVRHKILDCIGDMYLCGFIIHGHIVAERSGHSTNVKLIKQILSSPELYKINSEQTSREYLSAQA